jgi:hypothetical protein
LAARIRLPEVVGVVIRVEVRDAASGGALLRSLTGVFAGEALSLDSERLEVCVEGQAHDRAIVHVLDAVDAWLVEDGVESARIHVDDRSYLVRSPGRAAGVDERPVGRFAQGRGVTSGHLV